MSEFQCSVVIPAYNAAKYLDEALHSVFEQDTSLYYEIIVVDDGSTDQTLEVLSSYGERVRVLSKVNGGPASARNLGVDQALSDIILFLDADDRMLPGRIEFQGKYLLTHPDVGLAYGAVEYEVAPEFDDFKQFEFLPNNSEFTVIDNAYRYLVEKGMFIRYSNGVRKDAYLGIGGQPTHINVAEDYAMCMNIARTYKIACSNRKTNWYRQLHGGHLMRSPAAYYGPPRALADELVKIEKDPSLQDIYKSGRTRLQPLCNMLFRYDWICSNRVAFRQHLREFGVLISFEMKLKWWLAFLLVPSFFGRLAKQFKSCLSK